MSKSYNEVLCELHNSCGIFKVMWMGKNWNAYTHLLENLLEHGYLERNGRIIL